MIGRKKAPLNKKPLAGGVLNYFSQLFFLKQILQGQLVRLQALFHFVQVQFLPLFLLLRLQKKVRHDGPVGKRPWVI